MEKPPLQSTQHEFLTLNRYWLNSPNKFKPKIFGLVNFTWCELMNFHSNLKRYRMYFNDINCFNNQLKRYWIYSIHILCFLSVMTKFLWFFLETQYKNYLEASY